MKNIIVSAWQRCRDWALPWFDRILFAHEKELTDADRNYVADADWAVVQQNPRGSRVLVRVSLLAFAVLIVWAALAQIDEVTRG